MNPFRKNRKHRPPTGTDTAPSTPPAPASRFDATLYDTGSSVSGGYSSGCSPSSGSSTSYDSGSSSSSSCDSGG